jgi:hypothetical protein
VACYCLSQMRAGKSLKKNDETFFVHDSLLCYECSKVTNR